MLRLFILASAVPLLITAAWIPQRDALDAPAHFGFPGGSTSSLYRRLTTRCRVTPEGQPWDDTLLIAARSTEPRDNTSATSELLTAGSNNFTGKPVQQMPPFQCVEADFVPPLCFNVKFVCYFLQSGVWRDAGPFPQQAFLRDDNTTVLVYPYYKPAVHFSGTAGGSGLIYAAHGCILFCGYGKMWMESNYTRQTALGVPGENQPYCAVDWTRWDNIWVYNLEESAEGDQ